MTTRKHLGTLILLLGALLVANVAAVAKNSYKVKLPYPGSLNGTPIAAGEYKVTWEANSPEANVTFSKDREVVATARGKLVDSANKFDQSTVMYKTRSDGSRVITKIELAGAKQALVFAE